jgi:hypothetical protein
MFHFGVSSKREKSAPLGGLSEVCGKAVGLSGEAFVAEKQQALSNKRVQRTRVLLPAVARRSPLTRHPLGSLGPVSGLGSGTFSVTGVPSNR